MLAVFSCYWIYEFIGLGRKLNRSGISFGYIFLLFPVKIPVGYAHRRWENLDPQLFQRQPCLSRYGTVPRT